MNKARAQYPYMHSKTDADYSHYILEKQSITVGHEALSPTSRNSGTQHVPSVVPLMKEAGTHSKLYDFLTDYCIEAMHLGKLWGETTLKLLPCLGALLETDLSDNITLISLISSSKVV